MIRELYLVSVWLHIIAAMTWIGGMLFLVTVLVPMLRTPSMRERALELFHVIGVRFRLVGWISLATLILTGIINLNMRGFGLIQILTGGVFAGEWGTKLAIKLTLVAIIVVLSALHDFWLGPLAVRLGRAKETSPATRERLRRTASMMGRTTLLLALGVVALAVSLVR